MCLIRKAARAILLTPEAEILLVLVRLQGVEPFWMTPGGGLEAGESELDGLRRELQEEVGRSDMKIGPALRRLEHTYSYHGDRYCQHESYFVIPVDRFEPRMSDPTEMGETDGFRWWRLADLRTTAERIHPRSLADIVTAYLRNGAPAFPPLDVLVD